MSPLKITLLPCLSRRELLALLASGALPLGAIAADDPATLLRQGGCVLMLRHAQTESGSGDPPEFKLGCAVPNATRARPENKARCAWGNVSRRGACSHKRS